MPNAAVLIIGDEILSGKFPDENGPYLIGRLRTLGVDLERMVVLPDLVDDIAHEVRTCSERYDHVFTTGGVGPTHDDRTFEAVAKAFAVDLDIHQDLAALLDRYGMPRTEENLRMVRVPLGSELLRADLGGFPVLRVRNVFVLPGVPRLVRQKFEVVAPSLAAEAIRCVRVYANDRETDIAPALTRLDREHPAVEIGSYPRWGAEDHKLIVTLESRDDEALKVAREAVVAALDTVRVEGP